jgi:hypothetical protein
MTNYGLTKYQIQKAKEKIDFNKSYLASNGVQIDDKFVPFDQFVANSYINSDRYIAELQHRAWSIMEYAQERDLQNIFFTLTLPSEWHKQKTLRGKLVANKKFGGRKYITTINKVKFLNCKVSQNIPFIEPTLDFTETIDKYTPRNASKELSKMLKKFFNVRSYRDIEKEDRCYFRVTEPHKDGTPHLHVSLFVPADNVDAIVKSLKRLYPAPMGKVETDVKSPVRYLMKYILKTLDDLRDDEDKITNLSLWYLYHGISRFYTSRTFVCLEAYRRLNGMYTLRELTKEYHRGDVSIYLDSTTNKVVSIENEFGTIYTQKPVNWYDKLIDTDHTYLEAEYEPLFTPTEKRPIDIIIDGEQFTYFNGKVSQYTKKPYEMNMLELYEYFHSLDIETCNLKHYAITKNLMIDKGLLDEQKVDLSHYQDEFFSHVAETTSHDLHLEAEGVF